MRKLIVSEWLSLDGIFDAGSMNKWWMPFDSEGRQKHIQSTINNCEIMLYGRTTYEMLYPHWSSFKDNEQGVADRLNKGKKYVVSSQLKEANWENTRLISSNFIEVIEKIKLENGGYILMQGSASLLNPLMEAGLVDELRLLVNPAIVGSGQKLFAREFSGQLELLKMESLEKGVLLLIYKPVR